MSESGFLMNAQKNIPGGIPTLSGEGLLQLKQLPQVFQNLLGQADEDILLGQPLYLKQNGHLGLACASDGMRSRVCGLSTEDAAVGHICSYTNFGSVQRDDWNAIAPSSLIKVGQIYYLDVITGQITNIPPEIGYLVEIGRAINRCAIALNIQQSILL